MVEQEDVDKYSEAESEIFGGDATSITVPMPAEVESGPKGAAEEPAQSFKDLLEASFDRRKEIEVVVHSQEELDEAAEIFYDKYNYKEYVE